MVQWLRIRMPMQRRGFDPLSGKIPRAMELASLEHMLGGEGAQTQQLGKALSSNKESTQSEINK